MLHGQKIVFVSIIDNNNETVPNMGVRIWHHEKLVKSLLSNYTCLIGKNTFEITKWKGENTWVITRDRNWSKPGVNIINDIDDLHLHTEGDVYVLGGNSLYDQLQDYIDELHLYVVNNNKGRDPWIKIDMKNWKPLTYMNKNSWSYAHMKKINNYDPHSLNDELFI